MDLDELQQRWQEQDRKLDASLRLNRQVVRALEVQKVSGAMDRLSRFLIFEIVVNVVAVVLLGSYLGDRIGVVRFALPAATLLACSIALVISPALQLARIRAVDYGVPVVAIQKQLEAVRLLRLRTTRWTLLLATLAWTPLHIVALDGLCGIDVYRLLGARWIVANVLVGVAVIPLLLWMARLSVWRRFTRYLDGRNLTAARHFLASLERFEAEVPEWDEEIR
jgi:hypothetical protein